jgi:flavin-dependent dehydrogenase
LGYVLRRLLRPLPAGSSRLDHAAGKGWCAVGDAAAAHDPLSSQGILAALESGRRAGEAISSSAPGAMAVYDESMSEAYARYLAAWLGYYALEQRWPRHEFWRRRHQALLHVLGREHLPLRSADGPGQ